MSKLSKTLACAAFAAGLALALPGATQARHWHHHGGWYGFGPGFVLGLGLGYGRPYYYPPSYYRPPPAYYPPRDCDWVSERYWRRGRWHWRRVWRCW